MKCVCVLAQERLLSENEEMKSKLIMLKQQQQRRLTVHSANVSSEPTAGPPDAARTSGVFEMEALKTVQKLLEEGSKLSDKVIR